MYTTRIPAMTATSTFEDVISQYRLANEPERFEEVFKQLKITSYLQLWQTYCPREESHYHGTAHTQQVVLNAYEGSAWAQLSHRETKALVVAALFHDAMHDPSFRYDASNISNAKAKLKALHREAPDHERLSDEQLAIALLAIDTTKYPYDAGRVMEVTSQVLRDADHMAVYLENDEAYLQLMLGLFKEARYKNYLLTGREFLQSQQKYYSSREWASRWGQLKAFKLNYPLQAKAKMSLLTRINTNLFDPISPA